MADGATGLIAELLGEAFIDALAKSPSRSAERMRDAWRWVLSVAAAPPGVELVAPDGATYTGIVLIERSRAVVLLALRHPPRMSERHPFEGEAPLSRGHSLFDDGPWPPSDGAPFYR